MADTEIEELKRVVGVSTDQDLAAYLGVERSTVAQWKRRGGVPRKYQFLYRPKTAADIREALLNANRHHIFGHTAHHYWLAAALAVAPPELFRDTGEPPLLLGQRREKALVRIMGMALTLTMTELKKRRCETQADYEALVRALTTLRGDAIAEIVTSAMQDT